MFYTTLATLAAVILLFYFMMRVGGLRGKTGVNAPSCTGDETFERAFRVHMNSLEQFVIFLPMLWLGSQVVGDFYAGVAGGIWVIGRIVYSQAYMKDPKSKAMGSYLTVIPLAYFIVNVAWDSISGFI
ncbi:MAG: MAPEG family protein [Sphingomonadales bacterium]|jgi:glutathione S-transferase